MFIVDYQWLGSFRALELKEARARSQKTNRRWRQVVRTGRSGPAWALDPGRHPKSVIRQRSLGFHLENKGRWSESRLILLGRLKPWVEQEGCYGAMKKDNGFWKPRVYIVLPVGWFPTSNTEGSWCCGTRMPFPRLPSRNLCAQRWRIIPGMTTLGFCPPNPSRSYTVDFRIGWQKFFPVTLVNTTWCIIMAEQPRTLIWIGLSGGSNFPFY